MASKKAATRKASKKTARRKVSDKPRKAKELRELTKKARDEVAKLLAQERAGSIAPMELKTGLEELEEQLKRIFMFLHIL